MRDAVRDYLNRELFGITDRFVASTPVAHGPRQLEGFGDPATVFFTIEIDGQIHTLSVAQFSSQFVGVTGGAREAHAAP